jgi:hypothetical protein
MCLSGVRCYGGLPIGHGVEEELAGSDTSQLGFVIDLANDLATDDPEAVDVATDGLACKAKRVQVQEKGLEHVDEFLPEGFVLIVAGPALWPLVHQVEGLSRGVELA